MTFALLVLRPGKLKVHRETGVSRRPECTVRRDLRAPVRGPKRRWMFFLATT